jgi:Spondin_N
MKKNRLSISILIFLFATGSFLGGCGNGSHDNNDSQAIQKTFRVTVVNLTANQPFSPAAVVLHGKDYTPWVLGQAASTDIDALAEGGSPDAFITSAGTDPNVMDTVSGTAPIGMGAMDMFELTAGRDTDIYLSLASMLVNTNDAFVGIHSVNLETLAVGDSRVLFANALDTGTEANSEALSSIPGPAANGEGFNAARDDQDIITVHPGVITADDGLLTSILDETHRWDNPALKAAENSNLKTPDRVEQPDQGFKKFIRRHRRQPINSAGDFKGLQWPLSIPVENRGYRLRYPHPPPGK